VCTASSRRKLGGSVRMRTFTVDELEDLEVVYANELKEGLGARRWSETFAVVFQDDHDDKFYLVYVEEGLTENQELYGAERYPDAYRVGANHWVVDCPEVELYQEMISVTKWRKVSDA